MATTDQSPENRPMEAPYDEPSEQLPMSLVSKETGGSFEPPESAPDAQITLPAVSVNETPDQSVPSDIDLQLRRDSLDSSNIDTAMSDISTLITDVSQDAENDGTEEKNNESNEEGRVISDCEVKSGCEDGGDNLNESPKCSPIVIPFDNPINSPINSPNEDPTDSSNDAVPSFDSAAKRKDSGVKNSGGTLEPTHDPSQLENPFKQRSSSAEEEWNFRRSSQGDFESSEILDELMTYQGLEEVKQQFLDIKSKVEVYKKQDQEGGLKRLKSERFNIVFQGNPGTGKTTIARLYAKFLYEMGILQSSDFEETSGMKLVSMRTSELDSLLQEGVLFIDEAYQLTAPYIEGAGRRVLDVVLTAMENRIGRLAVIFVGYKDEMEPFFEHNPGLSSRIPYTMNFADFDDADLWRILANNIDKGYDGKMKVEEGLDGKYMRIAIRRLAQGRGSRGFGNARAVENLLALISQRQAQRLAKEKRQRRDSKLNYFLFTKEDLIGPDPSDAARDCQAWSELKRLIGLDQVKDCVQRLVGMLRLNYLRELREQSPLKFSLNQLFVGEPGTGKTTVAKLYGQILAKLGYLSRGDVVLKTPADFIGECLGKSEAKTRKILETTVGKVLVIDEAYMLDAGDPGKDQDKYKTGVIDTIVSMIQGVPGEDRCIVLVGYEDKIRNMFHNVNPGLSRRFPIERPFRFENFNLDQLERILRLKLRVDDLEATEEAIRTARDIFERALMRPRFSNAGEVDKILATAKLNYEMRLSQAAHEQIEDLDEAAHIFKLYPEDFDPDVRRGHDGELDCHGMLDGLVQKSIIDRLVDYQSSCRGARQAGLNPRDHVATNFIFKGPSGTGKTTTAQHMGKIFYNMGFLSDREVIECSATDLIGQYVGQTAPKTRKKLQEGMGRVLFIDEAYRLTSSTFAQEAVDEIIQFLTQPANIGKMVIILAGYTYDINKLMSQHPTLSGLFPEELIFETMKPSECISLLARELAESKVGEIGDLLNDPRSSDYPKVHRLFHALSVIPGWSNARDVKNLAKQVGRKFLKTMPQNPTQRELSFEDIIGCMKQMIVQRRRRLKTLSSDGNSTVPQQPGFSGNGNIPGLENPQLAPPPPPVHTTICAPGGSGNACGTSHSIDVDSGGGTTNTGVYHANADLLGTPMRRRPENFAGLGLGSGGLARGGEAPSGIHHRHDHDHGHSHSHSHAHSHDHELDAKRRNEIISKQDRERQKANEAIDKMGACSAGFSWVKVEGGYMCSANVDFISDVDLAAYMR